MQSPAAQTEQTAYLSAFFECHNADMRLFQYALGQGIGTAEILLADGRKANAAEYALQMFCKALEIGNPPYEQPNSVLKEVDTSASYLHVSVLIALEAMQNNTWGYGTRLLFDLKRNGITIRAAERNAFLALHGTVESMREVYEGNVMAVSFYCARLITLYNTLPGCGNGLIAADTEAMTDLKSHIAMLGDNSFETIEKLARTYVPVRIGNEKKIESFLKMLSDRTDFYQAPASARNNLCSPGGLAAHTIHVINRMAEYLLPATPAQIGEIVLAALCQSLCYLNHFVAIPKAYKQYKEGSQYADQKGSFDVVYYHIYKEKGGIPFGKGPTSAHLAQQCFGICLPESIMAALDACDYDQQRNPNVGLQMMEYPLGLWLHIADVCATFLDEAHTNRAVPMPKEQPDEDKAAPPGDQDAPAEMPEQAQVENK